MCVCVYVCVCVGVGSSFGSKLVTRPQQRAYLTVGRGGARAAMAIDVIDFALRCGSSGVSYAVCPGAEQLTGHPRVFLVLGITFALWLLWLVEIDLSAWRLFVWFSTSKGRALDHQPKGFCARERRHLHGIRRRAQVVCTRMC